MTISKKSPMTSARKVSSASNANIAVAKKNHLRTRIKHQRSTLTKPFQERSALAMLGHLEQTKLIDKNQRFAFYLPNKGEISCWPLLEYAISQGKDCYLPKIFPNRKRGIWFLPYHGKNSLAKGPYGILEPTAPISDAIRPSKLDVIFMPLIAVDNGGNRLGMGGGYYDSALANLDPKNKPQLVGLCYNFQLVPQINTEAWDVKVDAIATPSYYRNFNS